MDTLANRRRIDVEDRIRMISSTIRTTRKVMEWAYERQDMQAVTRYHKELAHWESRLEQLRKELEDA